MELSPPHYSEQEDDWFSLTSSSSEGFEHMKLDPIVTPIQIKHSAIIFPTLFSPIALSCGSACCYFSLSIHKVPSFFALQITPQHFVFLDPGSSSWFTPLALLIPILNVLNAV